MAFLPGQIGSVTDALLTPDQVERKRAEAALLQQQAMGGGAQNFLGALVQGLSGFQGGRMLSQADRAEAAGLASADEFINQGGLVPQALSGGAAPMTMGEPVAPQGMPTSPGQPMVSSNSDAAGYIKSGLMQRGMPEHVADAFIINFQDESGLNPGINEANPIVPGSRGGFGLYQLTGPRRREYEAYAASIGAPLDSIDAQLDFLMMELGGSEKAAADKIFSAQDTGSAAAAIVNSFLRPAEEHRARRSAKYAGGGATSFEPAPQQPQSPVIGSLLQAQSNPWVAQKYGGAIDAIMQQSMGRDDAAYEQQLKQQDPMYQAQLQQQQLQNEALMNPPAPDPVFQGGQWWDISSGQPQPLTQAQADQTAAQQNYEFLVSQGVDPQTAMDRAFSGGTTVNVGGEGMPGLGKLSADYGYVMDPATGQPVIDPATGLPQAAPVPGSPAAQQIAEAAQMAEGQQELANRSGSVVLQDIDRALEQSNTFGTTGLIGGQLSGLGGTPARDLDATLSTIRSNIGFDRLQQMREASPTGGALGAVSERELSELQAVLGNLSQNQSREQLQRNLNRLKEMYSEIVRKAESYPNAAQFGFGGAGQSEQQAPARMRYNPETGEFE